MRIAFDAKRAFHNSTGLGNYSRGVIDIVANSKRHDVSLYTPLNGKSFKSVPNNCKIITYDGPFANIKRLQGPPSNHDIDVFHGLSNELPIKRCGQMLVTIHDVIFKTHPQFYSRVDRSIYHLKTLNALKVADHIICTSQQTANELYKYYKVAKPISIVYQHLSWTGLDETLSNPHKEPYLLYVSSFEGRKNHLRLLKAFNQVKNQTNINLIFAGRERETYNEVRAYIEKENLEARVEIISEAKLKELRLLLKNAHGFIYPSLIEGFGIPMLEAMQYRIPIAASNIPVFNEIGGELAQYFDPLSVESISKAILHLSDKKSLNSEDQYVEKLNKFSAETHLSDLEEIYSKLH